MKEDLKLLPFVYIDGVPSLRDSDIIALFELIEADGILPVLNYEGSLPNVHAFFSVVKNAAYFAVVKFQGQTVGLVWLNRFEHRRAHLHWTTFAAAKGKGRVAMAKEVISRLINLRDKDGNPSLDVLWGVAPSSNVHAIGYMQLCGAKLCDEIPNYIFNAVTGKSEPGVIFYYAREQQGGI